MLGTRRLLRGLAATVVLAASLTAVSGVSTAEGASPAVHEVSVLSGSEHYVVYQKRVWRPRHNASPDSTATLFYATKHGKPHKLAVGSYWTTGSVYQAGAMVVFLSEPGSGWRWRNLDTGATGSFARDVPLPGTPPYGWASTGHVVGAAPDGWVLTRNLVPTTAMAPNDGFFLQHTDGTIVPLGTPSGGTKLDHASSTFLPFDGGDREGQTAGASLMSFATPGVYQLLGQPGELMHCRSASATRVACASYDTSAALKYGGIRVYDTSGASVLSAGTRCAVDSYNASMAPFALLGKGLAWVTAKRHGTGWGNYGQHCATHRLVVRTAAGKLVHEPGTYVAQPVSALGGVVVGNLAPGPASSTKLVLFTSAHHHRTLVTAR